MKQVANPVSPSSSKLLDGLTVSGAAIAAAFLWAAPAMAQDPPTAAPSNEPSAQSGGVEEVAVTARRREERAQDTPVAVTAINGAAIQALNVVRLDGVAQLAPSLRVSQASGSANAPALFIRGIGTITTALYQEPAVGIYVDGAYLPRATGDTFDLPDIDNIQVLRGPQGTLFGRNTTGGAILLETQTPTPDFGFRASVGAGSFNEAMASLVLNIGNVLGPFAVKLSAQTHARDGWVETPGHPNSQWGGALDTDSYGIAVHGDVTPQFTLDNRARYSTIVSYTGWEALGGSVNGRAFFGAGPSRGGPAFPIGLGPRDLQQRDPRTSGESYIRTWGDVLTGAYSFNDALTIKSITAYSEIAETLRANLGGGYTLGFVVNPVVPGRNIEPVSPHTTTSNPGAERLLTQEVQALGNIGDFNYLIGYYFFHENVNETITTIINSPLSATTAIRLNRSTNYHISSESQAAYGQLGWRPSFADDRLELTAGVRYTQDDKNLHSVGVSRTTTTTTTTQRADNSWDNTGWSLSASYKLLPDMMVYASAASSYRAGGYNGPTVGAPPFNPETAMSYEAGVKSEWFDRHVRLNLSVFETHYDDLQVNQFNSTTLTNVIANAAQAKYRGAEIEGSARFGGLTLDGNAGYVNPEYERYIFAGVTPIDVSATAHFAYVPQWTWHVGAGYEFSLGNLGSLTARADYSHQSNTWSYVVPQNTPNFAQVPKLGAESNLSARLIWRDEIDGHVITAQVFGDNLGDDRYLTFASDFSSIFSGTYNRPRTYGVKIGYDF